MNSEGRESPHGSFSVDEVAPNLFVGGAPIGPVTDLFHAMDLQLVINLSESNADEGRGVVPPEGRRYLWLPLPDGVEIERTPAVRAANRLALDVLRDGGRVLVHCREGYLRSVQFAGMLIEQVTMYASSDAVAAVAETRLGVAPHLSVDWRAPARDRRRVFWRAAGILAAAAAVIAIAINAAVVRQVPSPFNGTSNGEANPGRPAISSVGPAHSGHRTVALSTSRQPHAIAPRAGVHGTSAPGPSRAATARSTSAGAAPSHAASGSPSGTAPAPTPAQKGKGKPPSPPGKAKGTTKLHSGHSGHGAGPKSHPVKSAKPVKARTGTKGGSKPGKSG